jgi:peptidoglycan/LPS O-acetylase OafA/YrhL
VSRPLEQREVVQAGERRLATVESLRAIAAAGVLAGHAWGIAHGFGPSATDSFAGRVLYGGGFGVFLFFAITGYLIYWPFARRAFGDGRPIALRRYARNRALRILPLYVVSVVVVLVAFEDGETRGEWLRFLLMGETFSRATVTTVNPLLWSVVVEVHFYLLLPLLAAAVAALAGRSKARAASMLALLGAVSLAAWLWKVLPDGGDPLWRHNLPATFFYFVPGMLLALLRLHVGDRAPGGSDAWLAGAAVLSVLILQDYDWAPAIVVATFLAVGACVLPLREGPLLRALRWRPLALLGIASYSLYIWHLVVLEQLVAIDGFPDGTAATLAVTIPVCLAVAFASYRLIEVPFLRLRRRWT